MNSELAIVRALVELSDTLIDDFDIIEFLHRLCTYSVELLDVDAAGVILVDDEDRLTVLAASNGDIEVLNLFQIEHGQGPALTAYHSRQPVLARSKEVLLDRWPIFGESVTRNFASVYALPMRLRGDALGALNLYGRRPDILTHDDIPLSQALADIATIGLLQQQTIRKAHELSDQLQHALDSRTTIEQAKGKYRERYHVDAGVAFEALRSYSRSNNMKLVSVAEAFLNDDIAVGPF